MIPEPVKFELFLSVRATKWTKTRVLPTVWLCHISPETAGGACGVFHVGGVCGPGLETVLATTAHGQTDCKEPGKRREDFAAGAMGRAKRLSHGMQS